MNTYVQAVKGQSYWGTSHSACISQALTVSSARKACGHSASVSSSDSSTRVALLLLLPAASCHSRLRAKPCWAWQAGEEPEGMLRRQEAHQQAPLSAPQASAQASRHHSTAAVCSHA